MHFIVLALSELWFWLVLGWSESNFTGVLCFPSQYVPVLTSSATFVQPYAAKRCPSQVCICLAPRCYRNVG